MKVTKEMTFDAAHRLNNYNGPCGKIHGHTYRVRCTWGSELNPESGMVKDFKDCQEDMARMIDKLDHRLILAKNDNLVSAISASYADIYTMEGNPTAENMAAMIKRRVGCEEVTLWETPTSFATT